MRIVPASSGRAGRPGGGSCGSSAPGPARSGRSGAPRSPPARSGRRARVRRRPSGAGRSGGSCRSRAPGCTPARRRAAGQAGRAGAGMTMPAQLPGRAGIPAVRRTPVPTGFPGWMSLPGPLFRARGRRSAPQHHAHGRRLCGHRVPAVEDEQEQGREGKGHHRRHQRVPAARATGPRAASRQAARRCPRCRPGHVPFPVRCTCRRQRRASGLAGRVPHPRRSAPNLGARPAGDVMPAYRLPGLREDEPRPCGVLPWVDTGVRVSGSSRRGIGRAPRPHGRPE